MKSLPPEGTITRDQVSTRLLSTSTSTSFPVTAMTEAAWKTNSKSTFGTTMSSIASVVCGLPTRIFAARNDNESMGPLRGIPRPTKRPGKSWTVASKPPDITVNELSKQTHQIQIVNENKDDLLWNELERVQELCVDATTSEGLVSNKG
jgi:hypothetical protein